MVLMHGWNWVPCDRVATAAGNLGWIRGGTFQGQFVGSDDVWLTQWSQYIEWFNNTRRALNGTSNFVLDR